MVSTPTADLNTTLPWVSIAPWRHPGASRSIDHPAEIMNSQLSFQRQHVKLVIDGDFHINGEGRKLRPVKAVSVGHQSCKRPAG